MAKVDPTKHRVLLVGPRVVQLQPLFAKRRYPVVVASKGVEGMAQLDTAPCDVVLLELNLGDLTATEFLMAARQEHPRATFLLVDESTKASQIVKSFQAGLDGYLSTPPDPERLFYEVERHINRVDPESSTSSTALGFEDLSTQTAMQSMVEAAAIAADRESQLAEIQEELARALQTRRRFEEVQQTFKSVLEGPLDASSAQQLCELVRLGRLAQTEIDAHRTEVQVAREAKARIEDALRNLRHARNDAIDAQTSRVGDLESEIMVLEGRVEAAEEAGAAATGALQSARDEAAEAQLARDEAKTALRGARDETAEALASVESLKILVTEGDVWIASLRQDAVAAERAHKDALAAERATHKDALIAERANQKEALATLRGILESERNARQEDLSTSKATVEGLLGDVRDANAALVRRSNEANVARAALEQELSDLGAALEAERVKAAEERVRRSAREQEAVHSAVANEALRLQKMHEISLAEARAGVAAAVAKRVDIERLRLAAETRTAVDHATDSALQLDEARMRIEFLEQDASRIRQEGADKIGRLQQEADDRVRELESSFKKERLRLVEEKQSAASGSQEAAIHLEKFSAENVGLKKQNAELLVTNAKLEASAAAATERAGHALEMAARATARAKGVAEGGERVEAAMGGLQVHARALEEQLVTARAEHERALTAAAAVHATALRTQEAEHARRIEESRSNVEAARQTYEAQLSEQRQLLEEERARVRTEAQAVHAQASQFVADLQRRTQEFEPIVAERDNLRVRLKGVQADAEAQYAQLLVQFSERQGEIDSLRAQLSILETMSAVPLPSEDTELLQVRIADLERQVISDPAVLATVRSLVDAVEPLRWGLGSAIDYMHPFESNDQALATHIRHLRLLQATLARLATESGR